MLTDFKTCFSLFAGLLSRYSPPARGDRRLLQVNVRHLLQHSAGWDREEVGDPVFWRHIGTEMGVHEPVDQHTLIAYMMTQKLQFSPGREVLYRCQENLNKDRSTVEELGA